MRRSLLSVAVAVSLAAGGALLGVAGPASTAYADDNPAVCSKVSNYNKTLREALDAQVGQINSLTQSGDVSGAAAVAKQLGASLQTWATQVQQAAATASDQNLKSALTAAVNDAQQLSQQLMAYDGTQKISLDQFGSDNLKINSICGFTTVPSSPSPMSS